MLSMAGQMAWEKRYLPRLHPPCVVDRLCGYNTEIKVPELSLCFIEIGTLAHTGVLVRTGLRWGSSPREGFR